MRDAFGGAFMIKLFLVFIIIYVSFTALALNYAKAFKVKNQIINYIENNEEINFSNLPKKDQDQLDNDFGKIIQKMNYYENINCNISSVYCNHGIKIDEIDGKGAMGGKYYKVTTTFGWNINFFNVLKKMNGQSNETAPFGRWNISGETRLVINDDVNNTDKEYKYS